MTHCWVADTAEEADESRERAVPDRGDITGSQRRSRIWKPLTAVGGEHRTSPRNATNSPCTSKGTSRVCAGHRASRPNPSPVRGLAPKKRAFALAEGPLIHLWNSSCLHPLLDACSQRVQNIDPYHTGKPCASDWGAGMTLPYLPGLFKVVQEQHSSHSLKP